MNIRNKIILGSVLGSLLTVIGVGYLVATTADKIAVESLRESSEKSLVAFERLKKKQVEDYFTTIRGQLITYAYDKMIIEAMRDFSIEFERLGFDINDGTLDVNANSFPALGTYYNEAFTNKFRELNNGDNPEANELLAPLDTRSRLLQNLYIAENSNPVGSKDALEAASDGSRYSGLHKQYHPFIRRYLQEFGFYDIFLVNNEGDVVYSVFKEVDYATNLQTGPYSDSGIADAFNASAGNDVAPGSVQTIDFKSYLPSYNGAAAFFSSPIYDGNKKLGVLIMQAPVDKLNDLMTSEESWEEVGLGETGQTYIVGNDNLLRNDSRSLIEDNDSYIKALREANDPNIAQIIAKGSSIGLQRVDTEGTRDAFQGNEGFGIFPNYRGIRVLSSYTPLNIPGLNWVLMSEIDEEEAFRPISVMEQNIFKNTVLIGLAALGLFALGAFLLIRSITKPLSKLSRTIALVSEGDMGARANLKSGDELEGVGNAFDSMLDERNVIVNKISKDNEQLNESVIVLMEATASLADRDLTVDIPVAEDVTGAVSDALNLMVEETAEVLAEITKITKQVDNSVKLVQAQTTSVKGAADREKLIVKSTIGELKQVSDSIRNIGGLVQTIGTLARNVHLSSTSTAESVGKNIQGMDKMRSSVNDTEENIKLLGTSSHKIGNIVDIINTLSERTNILAVSASMQAENAGEAGLEFSVIADEIKRISESSKKSTFEITELIENIQEGTRNAISSMTSMIEQVNEGAELAARSGKEMSKTQIDAERLAEAISLISQESEAQNRANAQLMEQANKVLQSTEVTSAELEKQGIQTKNLVVYAHRLRTEVGSFKLPVE